MLPSDGPQDRRGHQARIGVDHRTAVEFDEVRLEKDGGSLEVRTDRDQAIKDDRSEIALIGRSRHDGHVGFPGRSEGGGIPRRRTWSISKPCADDHRSRDRRSSPGRAAEERPSTEVRAMRRHHRSLHGPIAFRANACQARMTLSSVPMSARTWFARSASTASADWNARSAQLAVASERSPDASERHVSSSRRPRGS